MTVGCHDQFSLAKQIHALESARDQIIAEIARLRALLDGAGAVQSAAAETGTVQQPAGGDATRPLQGLKLAVIGPSFREQRYRELLEPLGATVLFAPSEEKLGKVCRVCSKAHGIVFITTYASHVVEHHVAAATARYGIPIVRLTFTGLERLKDAALELAPDMLAYKELLAETRGPAEARGAYEIKATASSGEKPAREPA